MKVLSYHLKYNGVPFYNNDIVFPNEHHFSQFIEGLVKLFFIIRGVSHEIVEIEKEYKYEKLDYCATRRKLFKQFQEAHEELFKILNDNYEYI